MTEQTMITTKYCYRCKVTKSILEFHAHATNYDRRQGYCKPCKIDSVKNPRIPKKKPRVCTVCASLSHRVTGPKCSECGLSFHD